MWSVGVSLSSNCHTTIQHWHCCLSCTLALISRCQQTFPTSVFSYFLHLFRTQLALSHRRVSSFVVARLATSNTTSFRSSSGTNGLLSFLCQPWFCVPVIPILFYLLAVLQYLDMKYSYLFCFILSFDQCRGIGRMLVQWLLSFPLGTFSFLFMLLYHFVLFTSWMLLLQGKMLCLSNLVHKLALTLVCTTPVIS